MHCLHQALISPLKGLNQTTPSESLASFPSNPRAICRLHTHTHTHTHMGERADTERERERTSAGADLERSTTSKKHDPLCTQTVQASKHNNTRTTPSHF